MNAFVEFVQNLWNNAKVEDAAIVAVLTLLARTLFVGVCRLGYRRLFGPTQELPLGALASKLAGALSIPNVEKAWQKTDTGIQVRDNTGGGFTYVTERGFDVKVNGNSVLGDLSKHERAALKALAINCRKALDQHQENQRKASTLNAADYTLARIVKV